MHPRVSALLRETTLYVLTIAAGMLVLIWGLRLYEADLRVPLYYNLDGDTNLSLEMIKSTIEHGWYYTNPDLGAPGTMDLHDFPMLDTLHFATFKVMGYWSQDSFLLLNIFYLAGYPLSILSCLFVLRHFGIAPLIAALASLLFAFQPYHFFRGNWHLFLAMYYTIPLAIMVVLWVARGDALFFVDGSSSWRFRPSMKGIAAIGIISLIATTGVYYAYFTGFLIVAASIIAMISQPKLSKITEAIVLAGLLMGLVVIQALPFLMYRHEHGKNPQVAIRTMEDVKIYGLETPYLVLPTIGHRIDKLRGVGRNMPTDPSRHFLLGPIKYVPEGHFTSLGIVGGLAYLMLWVSTLGLGSRLIRRIPYLTELAKINVAATILAVQGGIGTFIGLIGFREIRAYNRISIFLAFLSLFALASFINTLIRKQERIKRRYILTSIVLVAMTLAGIYDQIPAVIAPDYASEQADFRSDYKFVQEIEATVPSRSMILQIPFMGFPEVPPELELHGYALLRPTFHSNHLRWSFGSAKGRDVSEKVKDLSSKDPADMIKKAQDMGFGGIVVYRMGFKDEGKSLEQALASTLGIEPLVSDNHEMAFFRLNPKK